MLSFAPPSSDVEDLDATDGIAVSVVAGVRLFVVVFIVVDI